MLSVSRKLKSPRKIETFRSNLPLFREEKDQAGGQPNRASSSSGLFLMLQPLCVGLDCTLGETDAARTQEFVLRWSDRRGGPFREIVRQQWTFSPQGSTSEVEDYQVNLAQVAVLELALKPDLTPNNAVASLAMWRIA